MVESVFIIGATGKLGRELVSQIFDSGDANPRMHEELGQLTGTANEILISTGPYGFNGNEPYTVKAPGAGIDIRRPKHKKGPVASD
jgi:hypothetical protein